MSVDITGHREQFLAFVEPYTAGAEDGPARLKVEHSFRVLEHVEVLVETEGTASPPVARAALLAALYHDCGRFPQFRDYHTFVDDRSVDHALLGVEVIRGQGFLRHEADEVQNLVETAVRLHNRYALPDDLAPEPRLITDMVRDADKLDILRVMVQHLDGALPEKDTVVLSVRDEPGRWTPSLVDEVLAGRVVRYADLQYVNDFRLLLGTWLHDLRFAATRRTLAHNGLMENVLDGLPRSPELDTAVSYLRGLLEADGADETSTAPANN